MEKLRVKNVVFCGENPHMVLMQSGTETVAAAASYWHCTYSPHGEGNVFLLYLDAANAALNHPQLSVYADNAPLARYLTDTFNQHFEGWSDLGFGGAPIQSARFSKESASDVFYRVACQTESAHINVNWGAIHAGDLRTFPDLQGGGFGAAGNEHYHVANVIFLCETGSISINDHTASGTPQTQTLPDGQFSSSIFLALSETWLRAE